MNRKSLNPVLMRRLVVLGGLALLLGIIFALLAVRQQRTGTRQRFDRIAVGMTFTEVEQLVGRPPGSYATDPMDAMQFWQTNPDRTATGERICSWLFDDGYILVRFDRDDRVGIKTWEANGPPTFWDRVCGWVGW